MAVCSGSHYVPISPANGSTHFDFTYLTFIDPSTYPCPDLHKGYGEFGGMLLEDVSDEASSFSALPTSQFTLKPSTLDSCDKEQSINEWAGSQVKEDTPISNYSSRSASLPSTHLSSLESSLPVHIHVNTIKHVPQKDTPTTESVPTTEGVSPHDTGTSTRQPPPPSIDHTSWDAHTPSTSLTSLNKQSSKPSPHKSTIAATTVTKLFAAIKTESSASQTNSLPRTPLSSPSPILGHDPRRAADLIISKERAALSLSGTNHFIKHSPNGTEYRNNTHTKLQQEIENLPSSSTARYQKCQ